MTEPATTSPFAFAQCQPGVEAWLKEEVARLRPDLHAGLQRPGLVTFKATGAPFGEDEVVPSVLARVWACSAGPATDAAAVQAIAERVGARKAWVAPRDVGLDGEVPPAVVEEAQAHAQRWSEDLARAGLSVAGRAEPGERVLDVVTAPGEPALVGWHLAGPERHQEPGGHVTVQAPDVAPSRAWRKTAESLAWFGVRFGKKDLVLEIGAAPGGGTAVLAKAGARVLAIDPNPMDVDVLALPQVRWIERAVGDVRREELPHGITWVACDANIAAPPALRAIERLMPAVSPSVKGLLFTIKLNDAAAFRGVPKVLDRIRAMGFTDVRAMQLPANRRDLQVVGRVARR